MFLCIVRTAHVYPCPTSQILTAQLVILVKTRQLMQENAFLDALQNVHNSDDWDRIEAHHKQWYDNMRETHQKLDAKRA